MRDQHIRGSKSRSFVLLTCATIASCCTLTGCEGTPARTKSTVPLDPQADAFSAFGYKLDWRGYAFVDKGQKPRFMEPMGDVLAFQESGSTLSILEASSGGVRWSNQLAGPLTLFAKPMRDGRFVLASSETELFTLTLDTGTLAGRESFERVITTRPVIDGDLLIYGTSVGEVMAHVRGMGVKLWGFRMTGAIERAPVRIGSVVGVVAQSGDTVILEASTGSLLGRVRLFGGVTTDPVTDGTMMFVASTDQSLYGINPDGAGIAWRIRTSAPLRVQPSVVGGVLYCELPERGLCAIEPATGSVKWESKDLRGTVVCSRGVNVIAWDGKGVSLIEPSTGDVLSRMELPDVAMLSAEGTTDPVIYVTDAKGRIGKYLPR